MNTGNSVLKSSPVPVYFIPFKNNEEKCSYCGIEYSKTLKFEQKYCKNCLFWYIKYVDNNTCLDEYVKTKNTQRIGHKTAEHDYHEILYFTHLIPNTSSLNDYKFSVRTLGGGTYERKSFYLYEYGYQISSEWVRTDWVYTERVCSVNKKIIQILSLSWWDNFDKCVVCLQELKYTRQECQTWCQKWCSQCFIIYTGCRYCLTTNVIFGIRNRSQCKNCKRIFNIDITNIFSRNYIINDFVLIFKRNDTNSNSLKLMRYLYNSMIKCLIEWIPYSQFKDLRKIGEGGFSIIYKATWSDGIRDTVVALKKLYNSQNISNYFFNEIKSLSRCYDFFIKLGVIHFHGITQDPVTNEYILIMEYTEGGNLHNYLQKNFINVTWKEKLRILHDISFGLYWIHINELIHRDLHSGNILLSLNDPCRRWLIGDFGLSQPANNTSPNNEIYGVISYIAPEIFKGGTFSKESDIYSLGMIMWELTTGCKPFANVEHNVDLIYEIIDGKRPEITNDTPEFVANLMKKCWDPNPLKRPSIHQIRNNFYKRLRPDHEKMFEQAEKRRLELIQLKQLGPEFSEKTHPKAVYTSRTLSSLISKSSIINSSINSFNTKKEYITKKYELDINKIQSSSTQNINSSVYVTNSQHQNVSGPLNNLISTVTVNSLGKRNIEELEVETQKNKKQRKNIKADDSDKELN
ncbi:hypothetical protein RclHR1_06220012 [Rhizophagus clarus]|uniref:Kinase-like domain-containing protein n=1 Tax=Rhizophagus clarus TaxID=94130 RepID=A0A2Z6SI87_9GLOM|nr:hypothetical protein RclHR1_06220012 [Rhizophagus clarus]GES79320.1 kinase-like domain-containing protein [Rhizophagus clarus]